LISAMQYHVPPTLKEPAMSLDTATAAVMFSAIHPHFARHAGFRTINHA